MEQQGNLRILDARGDLVLAIDTLSDGIALSTRPKLDEIWRLHDMPFSPINFSSTIPQNMSNHEEANDGEIGE